MPKQTTVTGTTRRPARRRRAITAAKPSSETRARLAQSELLRDPRIRSLWPRLDPGQQEVALSPAKVVGHRYPLTSGEVAALTGLTERQIRYWADNGLIPCWRKGRRRLFEAAGLISAFGLARTKQHELQFYRSLLEEPVEVVSGQLAIARSVLASRMEAAKPSEARVLDESLRAFAG